MCFCFDGEDALVAYRLEECRERLSLPGISCSWPVSGEALWIGQQRHGVGHTFAGPVAQGAIDPYGEPPQPV